MKDMDESSSLDELGEAIFPALTVLLRDLVDIVSSIGRKAQVLRDDHYGFMCLTFLSRQEEHARSVIALESSRDTMLIARSMVEGMASLSWTATSNAHTPRDAAKKWRAYAVVHDWKLMKERQRRGLPVTQRTRERIEQRLQEDGDQFLTKKGQRTKESGSEVDERHYHKSWLCGATYKALLEESPGGVGNRVSWEQFSDFHHWGTGATGQALASSRGGLNYAAHSYGFAAWALDIAFRSLHQSALLTVQHFHFPQEAALGDVGTKFEELWDGLAGDGENAFPESQQ